MNGKKASPKSFLDTNIFVYTFDMAAPAKRATAQDLVAQALQERSGAISYQVVQEFLNVATRKFTRPMPIREAEDYLEQVLMPLCEVFPGTGLYFQALSVAASAKIAFYDALIVSAALSAGCGILLSEDLQHGRRIKGLEVRNPFV
jgi:predicted nucleic acid-binding protein